MELFNSSGWALISVAVATALFHTLIPDHWLPFVLVGNARGWRVGRTIAVSGLSALIHVALSVALGMLALAVGITTAEAVGETLEHAGSVMLILFGAVYAVWAWRKGGHFHPGGFRIHDERDATVCDGDEGDANPEHLHYHADQQLIERRNAWWLAVIVGINPCVLILPVIFATASRGTAAVAATCIAYAVPTALLMVGLSAAGVAGGRRFRLPVAARFMEVGSGLLIAALGLFLLFGHSAV
jgi:ABC-type nickel/cobalt efflux system permease component RcnA